MYYIDLDDEWHPDSYDTLHIGDVGMEEKWVFYWKLKRLPEEWEVSS